MTTAEPTRLLALFGQWGKNARVRNFPGPKFMAAMTHVEADQAWPADLQVVDLFAALEGRRIDEMPADGGGD